MAEQVGGHDDQPGCAEPALHRAGLQEGLLDGVQLAPVGQSLDRGDLPAGRLAGRDQAGADRLAVEVDGAGAALALLAGVLGPGQGEPFAQQVQQALAGPDVVDLLRGAVDRGGHPHQAALLRSSHAQVAARRAITASACRR